MHEVKAKGILSSKNGMNLYRGCTHGCVYCDSRSTCYQMQHDFEDIEVKINAVELFEDALRRKRKPCMITTGAMTDPYIPIELELQHTRQCLQLIERYGFGLAIQTKSNRILRDLDILKRINGKTKCVVQMTLTTFNEELCSLLEPNVSFTKERFEVIKIMKENGIPTVVWISPILPFINDTAENINGILDYCEIAEVKGVICYGMELTLREGNREYFYAFLDRKFPGLKKKYIQTFGNSYSLRSKYNRELMELLYGRCQKSGILYNTKEIFRYLNTFEQNNLPEQVSIFIPQK